MLGRDVPLDTVLAEAARLAAEAGRAPAALILECLPDRHTFVIRASHGWPVPPAAGDFAWAAGGHASLALDASPGGLVIGNLPGRKDEPALVSNMGLQAAAAVAIAGPDRPFGVLAIYSQHADAFDDETLTRLEALAALAAVAVQRGHRQAELDRERDERFRLASLVEGSEDAIVSATLDGTILTWNPGAERLYGYAAHEILGQDVSVLVPADRTADRHVLLERVRAGQRIPALDAVHRRKDGTPITISLSLSPVQDRHGRVVAVAGIAHDVTETRRIEGELRQSAKMEAVGRLAGGLAHDFNNMLTVIDGYSQLLLMKLPPDNPNRGLIEEIHKASERAADLTRQLMAFSRKSMVEPKVVNLSEVVQANAEMLARVIGDDVTIVTLLEPGLEHVMADAAQVDQVLVNLAINARDAMPHGGRLTIETANVQFEAAHGVPPREIPAGQYVLLAVTDTGVGMDPATKKRVFEPFFTTKGSGRGTGLGLAMLHSFVRQSGGHVTVYSEPGEGTTFKIYLPTVPLPLTPAPEAASGEAPSGTETILVVEDDAAVRQFTEAVLLAAGYAVLTAEGGSEALAVAGAHAGPIHLLVTDVVMPVLGGHALAEQFRAAHPEGRVLFTSGYTPDAVSRKGLAIPPAQFVQKPYSPATLCRQVRAVLDEPSATLRRRPGGRGNGSTPRET
jgi:PAS domain S-box-containing protein